jgi:hypothetical protein
MAKKLDWSKPFVQKNKNDLPKTTFHETNKKSKAKTTTLTARGAPDIKLLRQEVDRAMRKYRRGLS